MDSKKLGMFAAAALLATQANAGAGKKADTAAAKADGEVQCFGSCAPGCDGQVRKAKDEAACKAENGKWMTKTAFDAQKKGQPATDGKKTDAHKHK